jgi:hypothetical protein
MPKLATVGLANKNGLQYADDWSSGHLQASSTMSRIEVADANPLRLPKRSLFTTALIVATVMGDIR